LLAYRLVGIIILMSSINRLRQPDVTRQKVLDAAFAEFFRHGFQGGSLNRIVENAGVTKGALFHHFAGKQELGYAVVDEVIEPLLMARWLGGLAGAADPISVMQDSFRRYAREDIERGGWINGCPLNNMAQEMSPLDEGFRGRTDALYDRWRTTFAAALRKGMETGAVRGDASPEGAAALLVASQMGIWGTGKSSRDADLMLRACEAVCGYLEGLRPAEGSQHGRE
jgi:TetR/AcrR family transcriptional repressor of nem operon